MIYVDEFRQWGVLRQQTSHLTADSVEELRAFAQEIGIPKGRWHAGASTPHYDLNFGWRETALENGAVFVPAKDQARKRLQEKRDARNST